MTLEQRITAAIQAIGADIKAILTRVLPTGGSTGQVLSKSSATNYAVAWTTPATGDMLKSVYDTTANGIVDNAEALGAVAAANYARLDVTNTFAAKQTFMLPQVFKDLVAIAGVNYSSTFTQAAGALPSEWTRGTSWYATNATSITSTGTVAKLGVTSGGDALQYLNTGTLTDCTVQADLTRSGGILVRYNPATQTGYLFLINSDGSLFFNRLNNGSSDTALYNRVAPQVTSGTYKVVVTGTTFQLYENGTLINTIPDPNFSSGYAGIYSQAVATNSIDNFSASSTGLTLPAIGYVDVFIEGGALKVRNSSGTVTTYATSTAALDANSNLLLPTATANTTPATGTSLQARTEASRTFPSWITPDGVVHAVQESLAGGDVQFQYPASWTLPQGFSMSAGSGGSGTVGYVAPTVTSYTSSKARYAFKSGTTAAGSYYNFTNLGLSRWRGNAAGLGGFYAHFRFTCVLATGQAMVLGLATASPLNTATPSTNLHGIVLGCDSTDTVLNIMTRSGIGTATKTATTIALTSTDVYQMQLYCPPNASYIAVRIFDENTNTVIFDAQITATLPLNTAFLGPNYAVHNGATTTSAELHVLSYYSRC